MMMMMMMMMIIIIIIIIFNCSWAVTRWQWLVYMYTGFTTKFRSGGLHWKHVVATWHLGNNLRICSWTEGNQEKQNKKVKNM